MHVFLYYLKRLTGFRFFERYGTGWELRFSWAEITFKWGFALGICSFEDHYSFHIHLGWPNIFFKLPLPKRWHKEPEEGMEYWGLSIHMIEATIHLKWGSKYKIVNLPHVWEWVRTSYLMDDGGWFRIDKTDDCFGIRQDTRNIKWTEKYPYTYVLKSGKVQMVTAKVSVQEMEWRRSFLHWTKFLAKVQRYIDVEFSGEVGERAGSWKGGTTGCGYKMLKGEKPLDTLRRMEHERKF